MEITGLIPNRTRGDLFNETLWNEVKQRMNSKQLTELTKNAILITDQLNTDMENLQNRFNKFTYRSTFWGLFALVGDMLHLITTIIVLFVTLTYTRKFGLLGIGIVIIEPHRANAWSIFPEIKILPDISVHVMEDVVFISWILKIVLVVIFILMVLMLIFTNYCRTVKFTWHYGRFTPHNYIERDRQYIMYLNIYNKTRFFRYMNMENI